MTNLALVRAEADDVKRARRERIERLTVDRRPAMRQRHHLKPIPADAERMEQWLSLLRENDTTTRIEALRALLAAPSAINPREPLPTRD